MYLRKIISSGFKSFADKVTITLDKNHITGIVGPNGSGKSNVIDSVRWVMGEQNAKMLRGEKATDIIFAGSEKRKPLGMAEVTLVFDNSEGSTICPPEYRSEEEIALTRRLYMDGQREYFINKKPCRLKDIINFFTSTGLGGRSYSMIQQGQVDRILQAKPEQIREIIEEAAGTLIFKKRKQQAEKKLENTRLNLSRIDDILSELSRQKKALSEQVEKAKKWQETNHELTQTETTLLVHNHRFFSGKKAELTQEIQKIAESEVTLLADIAEFEAGLEGLQNELAEADPEVQALAEEITVLREKIASSEASLVSAISLSEGGDKRIIEIRSELAEEKSHRDSFEETYRVSKSALEQAELMAEQAQNLIETFDDRVFEFNENKRVFENKINDLSEELRNLERLTDQNSLRQETSGKNLEELTQIAHNLKVKISSQDDELSQTMIVVEGASLKASNRKRELDELGSEKELVNSRMSERASEVTGLIATRDEAKQEYMSLSARLEALNEINEQSLESKKAANKFVEVSNNDAYSLTESLSLGEKASEMSEAALSAFDNWANRIYLSQSDQFRTITDSIREHGAAGFSVTINAAADMKAIKSWCEENSAVSMKHYLDASSDELDELLSRLAYIDADCPDEPSKLPAGLILFTRSGMTFSSNSEVFLADKNIKGALFRKKELQSLALGSEKKAKLVEKTEEKIEKIKADQLKDQTSLRSIDEKIQLKNVEAMKAITDYESSRNAAELKRDQIVELRESLSNKEAEIDALSKEIERLLAEEESLASQKIKAREEKEQLIEDNQAISDEAEELKKQYDNAKIDLASAQTKAEGLRSGFEEQSSRLESLTLRVEKKEEALATIESDIVEAVSRRETLEKDIESFVYRREELEQTLLNKRESNAGILEQIKVLENKVKDVRSQLQKSQKQVSQKELELERVSIALENAFDQAKQRYHLDPATSDLEVPEDFKADKAASLVTRLRTKIESMGPINIMAIGEYDNLHERESFIAKQRQEVDSSADLLELAIEEIEENSEEKFLKAFHTLNHEFAELFPVLFPGGDAAIVLTDENKPLDGGVEIMVRLPGKKRQNMRLFSGGEKALTAIALIFGLLKSKPTPFCFLDEVDAPLDETNVGRYNKVLETLSERFQFIVITHNRRTMEVLNTLYGVTMQEPGVSKVVGVDLEKALPAHLQKAFKDKKTGATAS